ncbi:nociceptin receptor isoform X1 [Prionailurus bengalensis]|uniref:nociceptin receptor isoform X1 n=2 Tax=Prionailurus TaxID=37028 RepID=UPI001CAA2311|nr:nociceptin receptor isoform X1 [Prionailurus bengalensis]
MLPWDPAVARRPWGVSKLQVDLGLSPVSATLTGDFTPLRLNAPVCTKVVLMTMSRYQVALHAGRWHGVPLPCPILGGPLRQPPAGQPVPPEPQPQPAAPQPAAQCQPRRLPAPWAQGHHRRALPGRLHWGTAGKLPRHVCHPKVGWGPAKVPYWHTKMKTATNIYIFNLALADTLVLLTLPFQGTDVLLGFWPFGNALCKTVIAIDYYNMFTSTFTLTAMSVDRYVAICHPIRALDVRTSSKAQAVNVAIWALASVVGVPVAIMGSAQVEDEEIECLVEVPAPQDYWGPVFAIGIFLFSFIIPVLIISICYSLMIRRLRGVRLLSGSREKDRNLRRITRLVLVVVAVFVGCWTPVQVFVLVQGLGVQPGSETAVAVLRFCTALGYVNSCLNPILYAFLDENFKACFRKFCCAPALRREMQVSDRVRSIAKDVALACKTSETVPRPA